MPYTDTNHKRDPVRFKHSSTPGDIPSLVDGEIALNHADGKLFVGGRGGSTNSVQASLTPYWKSVGAEAWPVFKASIDATASESASVTPTYTGNGNPSVDGVWCAVTLPDGENVFYGYRNNTGLTAEMPCFLYNTKAGSLTTLPYTLRLNHIFGASLLPNGRIFLSSWHGSHPCYVVEPYSGEMIAVESSWQPYGVQWFSNGCVSLPGGDVVIVPDVGMGQFVPVFRWKTNRVELIPYSISAKGHRTGQLMPDGRVIFFGNGSAASNQLDIFDPAADTLERVVDDAGFVHRGGGLMNDGRVMVAPYLSPYLPHVFDPSDNSITPCAGGVLPSRAWSALPTPLGLTAMCGNSDVWLYDVETGVQVTATCPSSGPIMTRGGIMGCGSYGAVGIARLWDKDFEEDVLLSAYLNRQP